MQKADGYRGIWYCNQPVDSEYRYVYSGGLGTYCAKHLPLACYAAEVNKTFFCYGGTAADERRLLHMVSCYDHTTGLVPRPTLLLDKKTADAHDNPTIMLDGEGYVWIFSSAHGRQRPAYVFRSRQPYSIEDFELVRETNFSYPQAWWLAGKGFCFLHTIYVSNERTLRWMTSPDGRAWSESKLLAQIEKGHYQVSWRWGGKVGTCFNYHPPIEGQNHLNCRTNLYYVESGDFGATWTNAAGEALQTPLRQVQNEALVCDFQARGLLVYLKDLNFDQAGRPILLVVTSKGFQPGPAAGPRTWTTVRWTGREWDLREGLVSDNNYDTGCLHVEADGTWRIIAPTDTPPQPYNPGGEMAVWTSSDQGRTWVKQGVATSGSEYNHTYARRPVGAHPDFYALWADGHGRRPSESRIYFCDRTGRKVRRLPFVMEHDYAEPEEIR